MAKSIHSSETDWSFLKGDHASAYKQLPPDPKYVNLTVVSLRNPTSGLWMGFVPKVLLSGAVSAVLQYNCFSRSLAEVANRYFGIPLVNYYGDFGSPPLPPLLRKHYPFSPLPRPYLVPILTTTSLSSGGNSNFSA